MSTQEIAVWLNRRSVAHPYAENVINWMVTCDCQLNKTIERLQRAQKRGADVQGLTILI